MIHLVSNRNTRGFVCLMLVSAVLVTALGAQSAPTIALSDLAVNSDNPKFQYLGKGFAEIVAFELGKSPALRLVDREQRNAVLTEMEFALSGMSDESAQLDIGKLLSVRYLVYGSVTDMGDMLLVSLKMIDVESTQVVWSDQVMETGGRYAYIGAYLAKSLLGYFKAASPASVEKAVASTRASSTEAVVALSDGIASLDKGDKEEAKARLSQASALDPESELAKTLLGKLATASAKFKVVPERYAPYYNPAYLPLLSSDCTYFSTNFGWIAMGTKDENNNQIIITDTEGLWGVGEQRQGFNFGYKLPLGRSMGLAIELFQAKWSDSVVMDSNLPGFWYAQEGNQQSTAFGAHLSWGVAFNPRFSLGIGAFGSGIDWRRFSQSAGPDYVSDTLLSFGGLVAFALRNQAGTLAWDMMASWSTEAQHWFDTVGSVFARYNAPVYLEQTLTGTLAGGRLSLGIKQVSDLYPDRSVYYLRVMPMAEYWLAEFLALRLGAEGSTVLRADKADWGWGGTAGISLKFGTLDIDLNYTLRQRPSRSLEYLDVPESVLFLTLSYNGLFF